MRLIRTSISLAMMIALLLGGCTTSTDFEGTQFRCSDGTTCPLGFYCTDAMCVAMEVTQLVLIDAATDQPVAGFDPLEDGMNIDVATTGCELNVLARTIPARVGSVRFDVDAAGYSVGNDPPYAIGGTWGPDFRPWAPQTGTYTITATPFSGQSAGGTPGEPVSVTITVGGADGCSG